MVIIAIHQADQALYQHLKDMWYMPGETTLQLAGTQLLVQCVDWKHNAKHVIEYTMNAFPGLPLIITSAKTAPKQ